MKNKPAVRSSKTVYRGFFDVHTDLVARADGELFEYSYFSMNNEAVVVVATNPEGKLIMNREYRHPTGEWILGCPGGRLEIGEDPIEGAQRELFEETGYWSDEIILTGTCFPLPSLLNQKLHFLWAKNAYLKSSQHLDPFEFIEIELKTMEDVQKEILAGTRIDGLMCTAFWYKSMASC